MTPYTTGSMVKNYALQAVVLLLGLWQAGEALRAYAAGTHWLAYITAFVAAFCVAEAVWFVWTDWRFRRMWKETEEIRLALRNARSAREIEEVMARWRK
ncbi:hypothetical protein V8N76_004544 [Salmonella enterica]